MDPIVNYPDPYLTFSPNSPGRYPKALNPENLDPNSDSEHHQRSSIRSITWT